MKRKKLRMLSREYTHPYRIFRRRILLKHESFYHLKLIVPSNFDIIDNVVEVMTFLDRFRRIIMSGDKEIFLDMKNVKIMKTPSLLYMLAILNEAKKKKIRYSLVGKIPEDETDKYILESSGFYHFMKAHRKGDIKENTSIMAICYGVESDSGKMQELYAFLLRSIKLVRESTTQKYVFKVLAEMMTNTKEHAYDENDKIPNGWFMFAHKISETSVEITFLDTGVGIPTTVRKRLKDNLGGLRPKRSDSFTLCQPFAEKIVLKRIS